MTTTTIIGNSETEPTTQYANSTLDQTKPTEWVSPLNGDESSPDSGATGNGTLSEIAKCILERSTSADPNEANEVKFRKKSPPPGLEKTIPDERRRYTAVVDDSGLVQIGDGMMKLRTPKPVAAPNQQQHGSPDTIQIDHLMQLLTSRLCSLEEQSTSLEKCMDSYELSARSKLEDTRKQLKIRIDELVELYGRDINVEIQRKKGSLQQLERVTEEHLASSNKLLTQAQLKLSRMKITNEELRTLHDKILDSLVKTRKLQRDAGEFDCWIDFIPANPLQNDHCIGELQFQDPSMVPQSQLDSSNYNIPYNQAVCSFTDEWIPDKQRHSIGPTNFMHNQSSINGYSNLLQNLDKSNTRENDPWESKSFMIPQVPNHPPGIPAPANTPANLLQFDEKMNEFNLAAAQNPSLTDPSQFRRNWNDYTLTTVGIQKSVPFKVCTAVTPPSSQYPVQMRRRMVAPSISECCGELNPPSQLLYGPTPRMDNKRHSLGASLSAAQFNQHRRSLIIQPFSTFPNETCVENVCCTGTNTNALRPNLLSLDMQRPVIIDCYGEQPPRHLKCIKGLTFLGPNRLIVCENGRKSGHKNVLMFSITGTFLSYCGSNYVNPTGICRIPNDGLCVVDDGYAKVLSYDSFQIKQVISLEDDKDLRGSQERLNDPNSQAANSLSRQDRFGGMYCTEQLIYICDRKNPAVKVFDIRAGCQPIQTWFGNSAASTIGAHAARQTNPKLLPFSNPNFVHRKGDHIYVSDSGTNSVLVLTPDGQFVGDLKSVITSGSQSSSQPNKANIFNNPCGICDDGENLAVADLYNNRIQLFSRHCLIGSIYSPFIESPFSLAYHPMGILAISNGRPRTVTLYFGTAI